MLFFLHGLTNPYLLDKQVILLAFCQYCGAELAAESSFCPKCGKPNSKEQSGPSKMLRPTGITILAVLELIAGIIFIIAAIAIGAIASMGGPSMFGMMASTIGGFIAAILVMLAIFSFIISGALFSGKRWGRSIVIIFSIIDLILSVVSIAGGNVFSIVDIILNLIILYYMWRPHVIVYFNK